MVMTREEAREILDQVVANQKTLTACSGPHEFEPVSKDKKFSRRYRCKKCGGEVESLHKYWYEQGLKHGSRK